MQPPNTSAGNPNTWTVTGAVQTTAQASNGQYAKGWEVTYQLGSGHVGSVFLPGADLNPDAVKAAVAAAATKLASVINLSSG
jgi:hypothetical protein